MPSVSTGLKELQYAMYACQDGATLDGVEDSDIIDEQFRLLCNMGGTFSASPSWPTCIVENCTALLTKSGYTSATVMPKAIDEKAIYSCSTDGQVCTNILLQLQFE
jgi:hypothetical protein